MSYLGLRKITQKQFLFSLYIPSVPSFSIQNLFIKYLQSKCMLLMNDNNKQTTQLLEYLNYAFYKKNE
jgi:hypothetical protein